MVEIFINLYRFVVKHNQGDLLYKLFKYTSHLTIKLNELS